MSLAVVVLMAATAKPSCGADWPQWRGPFFTGASDEAGLPEEFDDHTRCWRVVLPGLGASTPVVWGDRVFVSALDKETGDLVALCFRRQDGALLWRQAAGIGFHPQHRDDLVAPSAMCNGDVVVFTFGTGDLLACTHDGTVRWRRNLQKDYGKFTNQWIYGSTPLLLDGLLYIQVLQTNPDAQANGPRTTSYVLGLEMESGVQRWKHPRLCTARGESQDAYTSPLPAGIGEARVVLIYGGDCLTAHDPVTGLERWRSVGWNTTHANNWRTIASPLVIADQVLLCTARGTRLAAVSLVKPAADTWTP
ncbi:MAG TPA: PQQ-binding-like beta-propeller repeat protein, partial [Planctomycetota bacterium]|nr:PQQ-binding-like beta-propeller repeat protein [Planctomycetota bacterium]